MSSVAASRLAHAAVSDLANRRFLTLYQTNRGGGAYRRYRELINALVQRGARVTHVSPAGFDPRGAAIEHVAASGAGETAGLPSLTKAVRRALTVASYDAAICFGVIDAIAVALARTLARSDTLLVVNFRGDNHASATWLRRHRGQHFAALRASVQVQAAEATAAMAAQRLLFVTENDSRSFSRRYRLLSPIIERKAAVIGNNVNPSWVDTTPKMAQLSCESPLLLFVGNIYLDGKGLRPLLDAFERLVSSCPGAQLVVVGDGPDSDALEARARDIGSSVEIVGRVSDVAPYYRRATLVVVPTESHEGSCNVALEGLGHGCVVIGSRLGGIEEILAADELLFAPGDSDALLARVKNTLTPRGFAHARALCEQRREALTFDWPETWLRAARLI